MKNNEKNYPNQTREVKPCNEDASKLKKQRLSEALRANLRKRKSQKRNRKMI